MECSKPNYHPQLLVAYCLVKKEVNDAFNKNNAEVSIKRIQVLLA